MISDTPGWRTDSYRILFPIGYCLLVLGLGVWTVEPLGAFTRRETLHALLLADGFLFAFAMGILLSEVPRATGSAAPGGPLVAGFSMGLMAMAAAALTGRFALAYAFHGASALALAIFLFRALPRAGMVRTPGAALALAGAKFAIAGACLGCLAEAGFLHAGFGRAAALAGFQGFSLLFILACIRWTWEPGPKAKPLAILPLSLWLAGSLGLELAAAYLPHPEIGSRAAYAARAAWMAFYIRRPAGYSSLFADLPAYAWCVRMGSLFVLAGAVLAAAFPERSLTFDHIGFLAGFAWISLTAATGVLVRGLAPARRRSGAALAALAGSTLLGAVAARSLAVHGDDGGSGLLPMAAGLAIFPLLVWAIAVFPALTGRKEGKVRP